MTHTPLPPPPSTDFIMMTTREAAEICRLKPATLRALRSAGRGPAFFKTPSGSVRYARPTLMAWLMATTVGTSEQAVTQVTT
jgi:hypothetical protein